MKITFFFRNSHWNHPYYTMVLDRNSSDVYIRIMYNRWDINLKSVVSLNEDNFVETSTLKLTAKYVQFLVLFLSNFMHRKRCLLNKRFLFIIIICVCIHFNVSVNFAYSVRPLIIHTLFVGEIVSKCLRSCENKTLA